MQQKTVCPDMEVGSGLSRGNAVMIADPRNGWRTAISKCSKLEAGPSAERCL